MLVCHCMRVTDRTIRQCVREGARCPEQVAESCFAGAACGGCVPVVEALIHLETHREPVSTRPPAPERAFDAVGT